MLLKEIKEMDSNSFELRQYSNLRINVEVDEFDHLEMLFTLDREGLIVDIAGETFTEAAKKEFIGKSYEFFFADDIERLKARGKFDLTLQGKISCYHITVQTRNENKERVLEIINLPIIQNGEVVGIYGVAREETILSALRNKVKENEEKFRVIIENSYDIVSLVGLDNRYIYVAPSHEKVLGIPPSEVEGRLTSDFIYPADLKKVNDYVHDLLSNANTSYPVIEVRKKNISGQLRLLETRGVPIKDNKGVITSILFICRDITDQRETEEAIQRNAKLNVIGELAAGIAHEIRNPLTSLKGFTQILAKENPLYGNIMLDELENVNSIIEELLLVAKPQARQKELVDCNQLIKKVIAFLNPEAALSNIRVTFNQSPIPLIHCVKHSIKQVIINIIKNAIDSLSNGGNIDIKTSEQDESIMIKVSDNGNGIDQEKLDRLGEPFYTTKEKGTGLGLMICFKIIEDHGGKLTFNSKLGQGTTVTILLPIKDTDTLKTPS
jgi:two-component system sporulation sensor kinase A